MNFILSLLGIALAAGMIKYRERLGDTIGEPAWMQKVGGVYTVILIAAVLIFFFSVASLTGTTDILLAPLTWLIPGLHNQGVPEGYF